MGRSTSRPSNDYGRVVELTAVIFGVSSQLEKLKWNFQRFIAEVDSSAVPGPIAYAALDYAKAATALQDWTISRYKSAVRRQAIEPILGEDPDEALLEAVSYQCVMRAIANAAKHGRWDDRLWEGGRVLIRLEMDGALIAEFLRNDPDADRMGDVFMSGLENGTSRYNLDLEKDGTSAAGTDALEQNLRCWEQLLERLKL